MNKHIHNFLKGMAGVWPALPRNYPHPTGGGFQSDARALGGDFASIGADMRRALKKNEQAPADSR